MLPVNFSNQMPKTRQFILWMTFFLGVLGITSSAIYLWGGSQFIIFLKTVTAIAAFFLIISLIVLWFSYSSRSVVKEKNNLLRQVKKVQKRVKRAQENLTEAMQQEEKIRQVSREKQEEKRQELNTLNRNLEIQTNELMIAQEHQRKTALQQLQNAHLEAGLEANQLDPTDIPGIGEVLIDKLHAAGIYTALDINSDAIQAIPSFGESKALSLVRWRDLLEHDLRKTQPDVLSEDQLGAIEEQYAPQIKKLNEEKTSAHESFEKSLKSISAREAEQVADAVAKQSEARQQLTELEMEKQEIQEKIDLYKDITFRKMLSSALISDPVTWQKKLLSFGVLFIFLVFGILIMAVLILVWVFPGINV